MSAPLTAAEEAEYKRIIDGLLAIADLTTISRKKIREGLGKALGGKDLDAQKTAIKALIVERFDTISSTAEANGAMSTSPPHQTLSPSHEDRPHSDATANGHSQSDDDHVTNGNGEIHVSSTEPRPAMNNGSLSHHLLSANEANTGKKRKHEDHEEADGAEGSEQAEEEEYTRPGGEDGDDDENSDEEADAEDADAKLAAKLQAEENKMARGRTTRGGAGTARPNSSKKNKGRSRKDQKNGKAGKPSKKKFKSASKVKDDDDSDAGGGGNDNSDEEGPAKSKRKAGGGFQKPFNLSPALSEVVHTSQLSRPQVVKKLWEHIKAHELQDPQDKRQILCDDKMLAVFKQAKISMFQMNKLLGTHLYPVDEE